MGLPTTPGANHSRSSPKLLFTLPLTVVLEEAEELHYRRPWAGSQETLVQVLGLHQPMV